MEDQPQGKSEAELYDELIDQAYEEAKQESPDEASARIPDAGSDDTESAEDSPAAKPQEDSEGETGLAELFDEPAPKQETKQEQREKSARGIIDSYIAKIEKGEIDLAVDSLPEWVEKGIAARLESEGKAKASAETESEKLKEMEKRQKVLEIKYLSRDIPKEQFPAYAKELKAILRESPSLPLDKAHKYAMIEAGVQDTKQGAQRIAIRPAAPATQKPVLTGKTISDRDIEAASPEELIKWYSKV